MYRQVLPWLDDGDAHCHHDFRHVLFQRLPAIRARWLEVDGLDGSALARFWKFRQVRRFFQNLAYRNGDLWRIPWLSQGSPRGPR